MRPVVITCRLSEIRKIRIRCRCGATFIAEVPEKIARALTLHPCPGCQAGFGVSRQPNGSWKIERVESMSDTVLIQDGHGEGDEDESVSYIGLRIRIIKAAGKDVGVGAVGADPHPEHIGKYGTIVGKLSMGGGHVTPKIKLDDGTLLTGAECWWEPVAM